MIYRELFFVGVFADIFLNVASRWEFAPSSIKALLPYFDAHCAAVAAIYAGITTAIVGALGIALSRFFLGNNSGLVSEICASFVAGFIADILIEKFQIFGPSLQPFFDEAGAGPWGGIAIAFAVSVVRIGHKMNVLPRL
ncbi:MAG: hypothetical protein CMM25_08235 [Rhodospirillaceae bacterium]|nr:hypothetical protein [Rhodospirillaceae bacterium]